MLTIVLDTSFILTCVQYRIDIKEALQDAIDQQFTIAIIDKTKNELKNKKEGKLAEQLLEKLNPTILTSRPEHNVDTAIASLPAENCMVATQDRGLKERLKKRRIPVLTIRQKRYIEQSA